MTTATERWTEIANYFDELVELEPSAREARLVQLDKDDEVIAADVSAHRAPGSAGDR